MNFFKSSITALFLIFLTACSANNASFTANNAAAEKFSARVWHQVVTWDGKLWLIGGLAKDGNKNDVWWSNDGVHWTLATASAGFSPRAGHQVEVFNNQLWVVGGLDNQGLKNDIWSSRDGIHWQL